MIRLHLPITCDLSYVTLCTAAGMLLECGDEPKELHISDEYYDDVQKFPGIQRIQVIVHPGDTLDWILRGTTHEVYNVSDKDPQSW